jgi:CRISPR-associated exonuclease Cas4
MHTDGMSYPEEDYLQLSGIQHFLFCRRQWALIHIERQWMDNLRTVDGQFMHKNAHDAQSHTRRGDILTVRGMKIHSARLGLSGECDVVEFRKSPDGVPLAIAAGTWQPFPIEYKRGTVKSDKMDEAQLCAQAMCLEEMLCCEIGEGALYYGETRHRLPVRFTPDLRQLVADTTRQMHELFQRGSTPKVKPTKSCNACSLKDLCLPKLMRAKSVCAYMRVQMEDMP